MTTVLTLKGEKRTKIVKMSSFISFLFIGFVIYGIYQAFFGMNRLPTGEYHTEETFPVGTYTLKTYVLDKSLSSDAVKGKLVFNKYNGKTKISIGIILNQQRKLIGLIIKQ